MVVLLVSPIGLVVVSSVVVVVSTFVIRHLFRVDAGAFLLVGLLIIGISAAGGWWLKSIAAEEAE